MVKVLDNYRNQYEKETGNAVCAVEIEESLIPKWEYVCWLESKLEKLAAKPDAQQLKSEIAEIADSVEDYTTTGADAGTVACIVRDLRQLSAV